MSRIDVRGGDDADPQGARPRARRGEARQGGGAGLRRRRDGGEPGQTCRRSPANSRSSASRRSCSRKGTIPARGRRSAEIARLTGGAYSAFDAGASARLEALLRAAAAYAAGGQRRSRARRTPTRRRGSCCRRCGAREVGVKSSRVEGSPGPRSRGRRFALGDTESVTAMNFVIGLILLFLLLSAIKQFARMDAAAAARLVRHGGGVLGLLGARCCCSCAAASALAAALAGMAASFAGWRTTGRRLGPSASRRRRRRPPGRVSTARSAMIEMRLDHDSGAMTGTVLAGAYAGRALETLSRPELLRSSPGARARRSRRRQPARDLSRPPVCRLA